MPIGASLGLRKFQHGKPSSSSMGQPYSLLQNPQSVQGVPTQTPTVSFDGPLPDCPSLNDGRLPDGPPFAAPVSSTNTYSILVPGRLVIGPPVQDISIGNLETSLYSVSGNASLDTFLAHRRSTQAKQIPALQYGLDFCIPFLLCSSQLLSSLR